MIDFNISAWPDKEIFFIISMTAEEKIAERLFMCATHTRTHALALIIIWKKCSIFSSTWNFLLSKTFCQFILLTIAQWPSSLRDAVEGNIEDMEIYFVVTSFQILNIFSSQFRMTFCWAIHLWLRRPFLRPYCYLSYRGKGTSFLEFRTLDRCVRRVTYRLKESW